MQPLDLQPPELPATEPLPFPDRDLPSPDPLAEARPVPDATWLADLRPRLDAEPKRPAEKVEPPAPEPPSELPSSDARSARLVPLPGRNEPPPYPATAVRLRHQGLVSVQLEVDAQGCVTRAAIKQSSGSALLDLVARKALSLWRFQGGPGAIEWQVEFRLGDRGPSVSSGQPRR
jgi:protein TonB